MYGVRAHHGVVSAERDRRGSESRGRFKRPARPVMDRAPGVKTIPSVDLLAIVLFSLLTASNISHLSCSYLFHLILCFSPLSLIYLSPCTLLFSSLLVSSRPPRMVSAKDLVRGKPRS